MSAFVSVENVSKYYRSSGVQAVDDVSFDIKKGETLGLVGESGCGKSTLARCVMKLSDIDSGNIRIADLNVSSLKSKVLRRQRRHFQIVFQDPYSALHPSFTVYRTLAEPLRIHGLHEDDRMARARELCQMVGLSEDDLWKFPHQFSGGQRQRICIARALASEPSFLLCDEPVSALDVSIQAQILNLLGDLQQRLQLTMLFISHDLSVVRFMSQRTAVMYLGRIVECGPSQQVFSNPRHPYTRLLVEAGHQSSKDRDDESDPQLRSGCLFAPRCQNVTTLCSTTPPTLSACGEDHIIACHHPVGEA